MIRHLVLFTFDAADADDRARRVRVIADALEPLAERIPGIVSLRVEADGSGIETHWDAALVTLHDSWEALAAYQAHPDHRAALDVVSSVIAGRAVVDFEE